MNEVIKEFKINNFIKQVLLTKSRRKIYYKEGDKIPNRILNNPEKYTFKDGVVFDTELNEKVIRNTRSFNKPRYHKISGNDMWAGINHHLRTKIGSEMKKYFYEYFRGTDPIEHYPIGIRLIITDNLFGRMGEDIDNMSFLYRKTIHDALCGNVEFLKVKSDEEIKPGGKQKYKFIPDREKYPAIITDDSRDYINEISTKIICKDIPDEDTNIIIQIYKS